MDAGAITSDGRKIHSARIEAVMDAVRGCDCLCGHNIVEFDSKYFGPFIIGRRPALVDTLYLSPLLFPSKPYHSLLKDDKLLSDELNNPLNDALKAKSLYEDEERAFRFLDASLADIYYELTRDDVHFSGFYKSVKYAPSRRFPLGRGLQSRILDCFKGKVCAHADIGRLLRDDKIACAYALALVSADNPQSLTPAWVLRHYPNVENVLHRLRGVRCSDSSCQWCSKNLDSKAALKRFFSFTEFRTFAGEPLQQQATEAAIRGESLLAIFPTGGGKSLAFQLPALISGETERGLTVIISPLQSLMKDQVENLEGKGISDAVYINGLLSPPERRESLRRLFEGEASLLYIAPESLRSKTIEKVLLSRTVSRFVVDEAHCFSAWGQDFRIEYMFIGDFIKGLMDAKGLKEPIPVSCFTATAKPKVISDIRDYFKAKLGLTLKLFSTDEVRTNLSYSVLYRKDDKEKYLTLRSLIEENNSSTIVYVNRTKTAETIAARLREDGFSAKFFHAQMAIPDKIRTQDEFMRGETKVIVATSAFGMGVDKSDVGLVVHYEISDSLENYVQEAGRAGRDVHSKAYCYVLYNDNDLNKHFILLNQTKLTLSEINQVWKAIKSLTSKRESIQISALEIARKAGWDEVRNIETKVKSALGALENAGYIRRGMNSPRIFATSIVPKNMDKAGEMIEACSELSGGEKTDARRIIRSLISERSRSGTGSSDAESRIDYLADILGMETRQVIRIVDKMRFAGILANDDDMRAYLRHAQTKKLNNYISLERKLLLILPTLDSRTSLKELNETLLAEGGNSSTREVKTILLYWMVRGYIEKVPLPDNEPVFIRPKMEISAACEKIARRNAVAQFILNVFYRKNAGDDNVAVEFSLAGLVKDYNESHLLEETDIPTMEDALLFLSRIGILSLEGGFMVLYNKLEINRLKEPGNTRFKKDEYRSLDEFYKQRIRQIHIVGKYANMMVANHDAALRYVHDYFSMDFNSFIEKYFKGEEANEISRNISISKYKEIFGSLTSVQSKVIADKDSQYILVPAGPGSGKTYVLVRKLASLILMEDVKSEQLLMLTFSRAAAIEFKKRLRELVGGAAEFVEIKTFHSYCFDLLGKVGTVKDSEHVINDALVALSDKRVERSRVTKSVLVLDEAQDMGGKEFELVQRLIRLNETMRVIAVGDDDQNIYSFRGSDSSCMAAFKDVYGATVYEMTENFRSAEGIVAFANSYARAISGRLKASSIIAARKERGNVSVKVHLAHNYEQAIANEVAVSHLSGKTGVLCFTNSDALTLTALLLRAGVKARRVQSNDGFPLSNLAEVRFFLSSLEEFSSGTLSEKQWDCAVSKLKEQYSNSMFLPLVVELIKGFEEDFPKNRRLSDFAYYLGEVSIDDFSPSGSPIVVSTIHKAKGREYDNVFVSLKGLSGDDVQRTVYVALTRARNFMSVHCERGVFSPEDLQTVRSEFGSQAVLTDSHDYGLPEEMVLQCSHKDVILNAFKAVQGYMSRLHAGTPLRVGDGSLWLDDGMSGTKRVVMFSSMLRDELSRHAAKGYIIASARVRCQVWWKDQHEEAANELPILILLPDLLLRRQ